MDNKIDKGVPLPEPKGLELYPLAELEVGDSIKFPIGLRKLVSPWAAKKKAKTGQEYTVRMVNRKECRIWRIS